MHSADREFQTRSSGSAVHRVLRHVATSLLAAVLTVVGGIVWDLGTAVSSGRGAVTPPEVDAYRLGPQDVVRLRVFEWRASRDEIFSWAALNANYTVGPSGSIAIPLLGELPAAGATTREMARAISDRLRDKLGLAQPPDTSVEIVSFRPVYTVGVLERPGEHAYRPGMTVLMAISLSGGVQKTQDAALLRLERELISSGGDLAALEQEKDGQEIRRLRLQAEAAGLALHFPPSITARRGEEHIDRLLAQETAIYESRRVSLETQVKALDGLLAFLRKEVASLTGQIAIHDRRTELVKVELDSVMQLTRQGLATAPRRLALERNYAEMQSDRLRLETGISRARQDISRTEITKLELTHKRTTEIAAEIAKVQTRLDELGVRIATVARLGAETRAYGQRRNERASRPDALRYQIIRVSNGQPVLLPATETMLMLPGDTLRVEFTDESSRPVPRSSPTFRSRPPTLPPSSSGDMPPSVPPGSKWERLGLFSPTQDPREEAPNP